MTPPTPSAGSRPWLALVALALLSIVLRPGATAVGPVLAELSASLGLSPTMSGLITALPGLCFSGFGAIAVAVAVRTGLVGGLTLSLGAIAAGLVLRTFAGDQFSFLTLTVLAFAGMGVANVLVPSFVKRYFPSRTPAAMSVYTVMLAVGATAGSALAAPISHAVPGGWRAALGVWGVLAVLTILPWAVLARHEPRHATASHHARNASLWGLFRSRRAVALAFFFGAQAMQAYVQFGWLAQILRDGGLPQTDAGLMVGLVAILGIPGGLVMPTVVARVRDLRPVIVTLGVLLVIGYVGVWLAPTRVPWLWAISLGLSGFAFATALALVTAKTRGHEVTARVSGFTQSVGYILAATGPFVVGAVFEATGSWTVPLLLLAGSSVVMVVAGLIASAPGFIDDELPATAGVAERL